MWKGWYIFYGQEWGRGVFSDHPLPLLLGTEPALHTLSTCYTPRHATSTLSFLERKDPRGSWGSIIDWDVFSKPAFSRSGFFDSPHTKPFLAITLYLLLQVLDKVVFKDNEEGGCWASGEVHERRCPIGTGGTQGGGLTWRMAWRTSEQSYLVGPTLPTGECPIWEF